MTKINTLLAAVLALSTVATPGCFEFGGASCGYNADGVWDCDIDVGLGNGGSYYGTTDDAVWIMWDSKFADQGYTVSSMEVTCIFDDGETEFSQVGDVYTDGVYADILFYGVPSHFDAECMGEVAFDNGPPQIMFSDEVPQGDVLVIQWEDEDVDNFWVRNNGLDIDND